MTVTRPAGRSASRMPARCLGILLLAFATLASGAGPAPMAKAPVVLGDLLARYWADTLRLNPDLALQQGEPGAEERFDDSLEDGWRADLLRTLRAYRREAHGIDRRHLAEQDRVSLDLLRYRLDEDLAFYGGPDFVVARQLPIDQFQGRHVAFALDAAGDGNYPFKTLADYRHALVRADRYARWVDEAIGRMREGLHAHVVLPRLVVERVLTQLAEYVGRAPEQTEFWRPLEKLPAELPDTVRDELRAAYRTKISTVIEPAYERLGRFLREEYLPQARSSVGLDGIPGGASLYRHYARSHTTTNLTPAAIHALGEAEVGRLTGELAAVQHALGVAGDVGALFAAARSDPAQKFGSPAEIVPAFDAARHVIEGRLPRLFDVSPKAEYQIRALPESARASQGNGNYAGPAADGSRPGILWINIWAPGVQDRFNVMTISLHEGLPGHHFQTALAQEQTALPALRRFDGTTAYVEGWGLYAESLGRELGVFDDPWAYFGHLNYALLRANRLVIDTGIHALGWDVSRGVEYMMAHSSMSREQATAEVERYVAYPGQALAYKVGELKLRALRTEAEAALGPKFDVRAFHDEVLLGGSMPLTILERHVRRWIAAGGRLPATAAQP